MRTISARKGDERECCDPRRSPTLSDLRVSRLLANKVGFAQSRAPAAPQSHRILSSSGPHRPCIGRAVGLAGTRGYVRLRASISADHRERRRTRRSTTAPPRIPWSAFGKTPQLCARPRLGRTNRPHNDKKILRSRLAGCQIRRARVKRHLLGFPRHALASPLLVLELLKLTRLKRAVVLAGLGGVLDPSAPHKNLGLL